jgi:hypothetical protein
MQHAKSSDRVAQRTVYSRVVVHSSEVTLVRNMAMQTH